MYTDAMNQLVGLSVEMGLVTRTVEEAQSYLADKQDVIHRAIRDSVDISPHDFDIAMALLDTAKSLITRDMLFRARASAHDRESDKYAILAMTKPEFATQYCKSHPNVAICNFYLGQRGELWAMVAQNLGEGRPIGKAILKILEGPDGLGFQAKLADYARALQSHQRDHALESHLLNVLGSAILSFFLKYGIPRKLILIPHRELHLLPLHAMFADTDTERFYLDGFVAEIEYASCLTELLYANVNLRQDTQRGEQNVGILAALDIGASELKWMETERLQFRALNEMGLSVDIVTSPNELPSDLSSYRFMNWSCHAVSDMYSWGNSYMSFGGKRISAATIADRWDLAARPVVTLASCQSGTNSPTLGLFDEYLGLDRAFKIAGASTVFASLWPVSDDLAALASFVLPLWIINHRVSAAHALVIFQSNLRRGIWKQWLLSDEQIGQIARVNKIAAELVFNAQSQFRKLHAGTFGGPEHWAVFRCYGE